MWHFSQDPKFTRKVATIQCMSMTHMHLLQKDLNGFLHKPRGSLQCPRKETHIILALDYIILNAAKVVSSHLTKVTPKAEASSLEVGNFTPQ